MAPNSMNELKQSIVNTPLRQLYYELMNYSDSKREGENRFTKEAERATSQFLQQMLTVCDSKLEQVMFEYSPRALDRFIMTNYEGTMDSYQKNKKNPFYNKHNARHYLLQQAPGKLIDGLWLQNTGRLIRERSISEEEKQVLTILNEIFEEEMGEGDEKKNHINIFRNLLNQAGMNLPETKSREFAFHDSFQTESFLSPVVQLALSLFQEEYTPELIGFTLNFEEAALSVLQMVDAVKDIGLNNYYYVLHVTIDNPCSGHSAQAKEAVNLYMKLFKDGNRGLVWRRILRGYLLATMMDFKCLSEQIQRKSDHMVRELMIDLIERYKPYAACPVHSRVRMNGDSLESQMKTRSAEEFLLELQESAWIVHGDPDKSLLCKSMSFGQKMYKVFSEEDEMIVRNWISSLKGRRTYHGFSSVELRSNYLKSAYTLIALVSLLFTLIPLCLMK